MFFWFSSYILSMKKTRFFFGHHLILAGLLGSLCLLDRAAEERVRAQEAYLVLAEKSAPEGTTVPENSASPTKKPAVSQPTQTSDPQSPVSKPAQTSDPQPPVSQPAQTSDSQPSVSKSAQTSALKSTQTNAPTIRVLLMTNGYSSYYHPSVTVEYNGKEVTYTPEDFAAGDSSNTLPELASGGSDSASAELGTSLTISPQQTGIRIPSLTRQCGAPVYQGALTIARREEGLLLINELPLETYLEAVVPSEMPSSYAEEALKAQAVCARTYAWKQKEEGRLKDYGADVDDSVSFQVYQNIAHHPSTTKAVQETAGEILCQNGEPVQAYYFSTSAGATSTDEIWGAEEAASYLKSVPCAFDAEEPWSRWQVEIPWNILETRAADHLGVPGTLLSVASTEKNESGAVTCLSVMTDAGSFQLEEEYQIRQFLSPQGLPITEKDGSTVTGGSLLPSSYFTEEAVPGTALRLTGGGYGHGVGMSQNAADEMAKEGYTYREILDYFFRDVEIERL